MANKVIYSSYFVRRAKHLRRSIPPLTLDLGYLEKSLKENPRQGDNLGAGLYKVRLAVQSKGKGKSGGYRVITNLIDQVNDEVFINMLTLYDKSEESSIDKQCLLKLLKEISD